MRYNRLKSSDLLTSSGGETGFNDGDHHHIHPVIKKAASMREHRLHGGTTTAIARACSEKYGVRQAILDCVSCGRASPPIVQDYSCRQHGVGDWTRSASTRSDCTNSKRKGVMHFCRQFIRIGKKLDKTSWRHMRAGISLTHWLTRSLSSWTCGVDPSDGSSHNNHVGSTKMHTGKTTALHSLLVF